jgi:hypothetical protein
MFDCDSLKILNHMRINRPDLYYKDIVYHSLVHDLVQADAAKELHGYCRRKSLYKKYRGTPIWTSTGNHKPVLKIWDSLQGHPSVGARRLRNKKRNASSYRIVRGEAISTRAAAELDPRTSHWFNRQAI